MFWRAEQLKPLLKEIANDCGHDSSYPYTHDEAGYEEKPISVIGGWIYEHHFPFVKKAHI